MKINLSYRHKKIDTKPLEDLLDDPMWIRIFDEHDQQEQWYYKILRKIRLFLDL